MNKNKYQNYRLTYPIFGNKIYQSRSFKRAVDNCYKEYKKLNGKCEGTFSVTNLDTNITYSYKIDNKKKSSSVKQNISTF